MIAVDSLPTSLLALADLALDPSQALSRGGYDLDAWQRSVVSQLGRPRRSGEMPRRVIVVTARQVGKSLTAAGAVAARLVLEPGCLIVILSASTKQAAEVARHVRRLLAGVLVDAQDVSAESQSQVELSNGSRVTIVAASSTSVRGWSADLLVVDEAAYIDDETIDAVLPTIAASGGDLVVLSTPVAPTGRFYDLWQESELRTDRWQSVRVRAADCMRLPPEEIAAMRTRLAPTRAARDLDAEFVEPAGAIVSALALAAAFATDGHEEGWEW